MQPLISVIICTHNPRSAYLTRVLDGLRQQTLTQDHWELLLIDNHSNERLSDVWDLRWHSHARHIREEELGLTPARLRGILEARGQLLVFADDDNVLAHDYLEVADSLARQHPHIGAFGGSIKGEFEIAPPEWIGRYLTGLAVCEIDRDYWSNLPVWSVASPYGAGLCVRRNVAEDYSRKLIQNPNRKLLDRIGTGMGSGGDGDLAWCATDCGMGTARFHVLKLTHLIPQSRLTRQYVIRLYAGFAASSVILDYLRGAGCPNKRAGVVEIGRLVWRLIHSSAIERRILLTSRKEQERAWDLLASASGSNSVAGYSGGRV